MNERIVSAALRQGDTEHTGKSHKEILDRLTPKPANLEYGFKTSEGRFVGRIEGGMIAVIAGQTSAKKLREGGGALHSQMLTMEEL